MRIDPTAHGCMIAPQTQGVMAALGEARFVGGAVRNALLGLAVIDIENGRFVLREKLPSMSVEELQAVTGAELVLPDVIGDLVAPEVS